MNGKLAKKLRKLNKYKDQAIDLTVRYEVNPETRAMHLLQFSPRFNYQNTKKLYKYLRKNGQTVDFV